MIIRNIPVQEQFRPKFMGVYWAVPWVDRELVKKSFLAFVFERRQSISEYADMTTRRLKKTVNEEIPDEVYDDLRDESRYPEAYADILREFASTDFFAQAFGFADNAACDMKIIINNEAVKVHGREYSTLSSENLKAFIDDGLYVLRPSSVAEEKISVELNPDVKVLFEHAIVDGCTDFEAHMTAIGVDIIDRIEIPPVGWYEYVGPDFGIDPLTFGQLTLGKRMKAVTTS